MVVTRNSKSALPSPNESRAHRTSDRISLTFVYCSVCDCVPPPRLAAAAGPSDPTSGPSRTEVQATTYGIAYAPDPILHLVAPTRLTELNRTAVAASDYTQVVRPQSSEGQKRNSTHRSHRVPLTIQFKDSSKRQQRHMIHHNDHQSRHQPSRAHTRG